MIQLLGDKTSLFVHFNPNDTIRQTFILLIRGCKSLVSSYLSVWLIFSVQINRISYSSSLDIWVCSDNLCNAEVHGEGLWPHDRGAGQRRGIQRRLPAGGYRYLCVRLRTEGHEGNIDSYVKSHTNITLIFEIKALIEKRVMGSKVLVGSTKMKAIPFSIISISRIPGLRLKKYKCYI